MSNSINQVTLLGRLGKDAELRQTQSGKSVLNWSMATSEQWKDDKGVKQERTEWHTCVMWGPLGPAVAAYMTKGKRIHVTGQLQTRKWTDKNNVDRYSTEINVRDMVLLDGGTERSQTQSNGQSPPAGGSRSYQRPAPPAVPPNNQGMPWDNAPSAPADAPVNEYGEPMEGHPDFIPF
jgi:single-strand DNA-binding protein